MNCPSLCGQYTLVWFLLHAVEFYIPQSVASADIANEVRHLLSRLECNANDLTLDVTTRHSHGNLKALAKEQQRKIALGHKLANNEKG